MGSLVFALVALSIPTAAQPIIYVLPMGEALPKADVDAVRGALVSFYAVDVRVMPRVPLPASSYTKARKRWRAEESVYATNVVWHTRVGKNMQIAGQARFVVIQDLEDCVDDGFYVYIWEDLGPGGGGIARADP
jgi:hypothetical protein